MPKLPTIYNRKEGSAMKKQVFSYDESYDLDNVYNCENDELYAEVGGGESSVWYNWDSCQ